MKVASQAQLQLYFLLYGNRSCTYWCFLEGMQFFKIAFLQSVLVFIVCIIDGRVEYVRKKPPRLSTSSVWGRIQVQHSNHTSAINWLCDLGQITEKISGARFSYLKNQRVGLDDPVQP